MSTCGARGVLFFVLLGSALQASGYGEADSGTQVKVDPGQDKKLQDAMGGYMAKQAQPKK